MSAPASPTPSPPRPSPCPFVQPRASSVTARPSSRHLAFSRRKLLHQLHRQPMRLTYPHPTASPTSIPRSRSTEHVGTSTPCTLPTLFFLGCFPVPCVTWTARLGWVVRTKPEERACRFADAAGGIADVHTFLYALHPGFYSASFAPGTSARLEIRHVESEGGLFAKHDPGARRR